MVAGPSGPPPGSERAAAGGGRAVGTGCAELVLPLFSTNYHRQPTGSDRRLGRRGPAGVARRPLRAAPSRLLLVHLMAHPLDPRATVRRLEAAGVAPTAAEAIAAAIVSSRSDPVTKADPQAAPAVARADLRAELAGVERRPILIGVATAGCRSLPSVSSADRPGAHGPSVATGGLGSATAPTGRRTILPRPVGNTRDRCETK